MKVRILESARRDLRKGHSFYESQQQGVGDYFLDTLFGDIDSLAVYGGTHARRFGFHWVLSSRFPFAIYYQIEEGCAVVRAVLDCRRDPRWIQRRLKQERTRRSSK